MSSFPWSWNPPWFTTSLIHSSMHRKNGTKVRFGMYIYPRSRYCKYWGMSDLSFVLIACKICISWDNISRLSSWWHFLISLYRIWSIELNVAPPIWMYTSSHQYLVCQLIQLQWLILHYFYAFAVVGYHILYHGTWADTMVTFKVPRALYAHNMPVDK